MEERSSMLFFLSPLTWGRQKRDIKPLASKVEMVQSYLANKNEIPLLCALENVFTSCTVCADCVAMSDQKAKKKVFESKTLTFG